MVAAMRSGLQRGQVERKQVAGHALLLIGGTALFIQMWAMWLESGPILTGGTAASLGWMGALGMATLQMVNFFAFHPNGKFGYVNLAKEK